MGWLVVIASGLLYGLVVAIAWVSLWWRTRRDGAPPTWLVEASGVVACTPAAAFALVGDPRNDPLHTPNTLAVVADAPGGPRVGFGYREDVRVGVATLTLACAITAIDPPSAIDLRCTYGRRVALGGYRVAPHPGGCLVTVRTGSTLTAGGVPTLPVARWLARRECGKDVDRIRAILAGTPRGPAAAAPRR